MVLIPAEKVVRGTEEEIGEFDERPVRIVTLSPYWIDLKEVTHAQYQKFIEKTGRHRQEVMVFYDDVALLYAPELPAVGVSWFDAQDYCAWNGKRLPTEAEWEYAAGGNGRGGWPWGETFLKGYANIRDGEDGFAYTAPVGSYEVGRSHFGLYDVAGNVGEWVEDWYDEFFYKE
jgi:formylglycine-generating enzyme required for sulfatase activity